MTGLAVVVIYHDPSDYPGRYVARRQWATERGVEVEPAPMLVADSLPAIQACIPMGMIRFNRHPLDDEAIVESWM